MAEENPLPPSDRVSDADWRMDIERLYKERSGALIHHFAGRIRDRESARDLVHEAFSRLAALNFARRLLVTKPESYLFRICLNLIRDRARAQAVCLVHTDHTITGHQCDNPIVHLESRDALRRLEKAMLGLKPKTRAIFLARRLDGLSYAEISERTGLSIKGVEKQMAKAIATLDRLMERHKP